MAHEAQTATQINRRQKDTRWIVDLAIQLLENVTNGKYCFPLTFKRLQGVHQSIMVEISINCNKTHNLSQFRVSWGQPLEP